MRRSLRARLSLAMVALAALGMAVVTAATVVALPIYFRTGADVELTRVRDALEARSANAAAVDDTIRSSYTAGGTLFVRLVDRNGATVSESQARDLDDRPLPAPALPEPLPPEFGSSPATVTAASGEYRVITVRLGNGAGRAVIAQSLAPSRSVTGWILLFDSIVALVALLGVAAISRTVLKVGLRPLRDMASKANAIASGDSDQRLDIGARDDEIDELGSALNRAFAARRRSEDRLRRFVADASHELRTPLTMIQGWAQLQTHGLATDEEITRRGMRRIEEEAARMHRMVEDLLLLARLDQGHEPARTPVDVSALVRDAVADIHAMHPRRPVTVAASERLFAEVDEDRVLQAVRNLLVNALQHTPAGTSVDVVVRPGAAGTVEIVVADDGPGMSPEQAARVFERFFRGEPGRHPRNGGAGLGLSIVAAIVEAHGGTVTVDSAPGRGTAVTIVVPGLA